MISWDDEVPVHPADRARRLMFLRGARLRVARKRLTLAHREPDGAVRHKRVKRRRDILRALMKEEARDAQTRAIERRDRLRRARRVLDRWGGSAPNRRVRLGR